VTAYLSLDQVLALHKAQIDEYGGAHGLRERNGLESAVARPQRTFGGEDLYPDLSDKAAPLWHSLVVNHPFIDGNKRIGAMAAELFLIVNGVDLLAADDDLVDITMATARGEMSAEALAIWIRQRSRESDG
jgi:death-on-curing protein